MDLKSKALIVLAIAGLSYGLGRYLQPAKVEVREVIKEVKVVERDTEYIDREVRRPDGTIERERIERERTKVDERRESDTSKIVSNLKPQWKVQALAGANPTDFNKQDIYYGVGIERRVFGSLFAGGWVNTRKEVGVSVSFEF